MCVPEQDHERYWEILRGQYESRFGGAGSTLNFWQLSAHSERLTLGVKMHSTAAFLSVPNKEWIALGGNSSRGFNDNVMRGYPERLTLTTRQVTDVVMFDEEILSVKGGRQVNTDFDEPMDEEMRREREFARSFALRYLDGYSDTKVIDPIKENYPACTMPLSATSPTYVTPEICATHSTHRSTYMLL